MKKIIFLFLFIILSNSALAGGFKTEQDCRSFADKLMDQFINSNFQEGLNSAKQYWPMPEIEIDEFLFSRKVNLIANKGRQKLGRGDDAVGRKVPHMMTQSGLKSVDVRVNDKIFYAEPPYETEIQRTSIEKMKKGVLDEDRRTIGWERGDTMSYLVRSWLPFLRIRSLHVVDAGSLDQTQFG